jgi:hypothetical protein
MDMKLNVELTFTRMLNLFTGQNWKHGLTHYDVIENLYVFVTRESIR